MTMRARRHFHNFIPAFAVANGTDHFLILRVSGLFGFFYCFDFNCDRDTIWLLWPELAFTANTSLATAMCAILDQIDHVADPHAGATTDGNHYIGTHGIYTRSVTNVARHAMLAAAHRTGSVTVKAGSVTMRHGRSFANFSRQDKKLVNPIVVPFLARAKLYIRFALMLQEYRLLSSISIVDY